MVYQITLEQQGVTAKLRLMLEIIAGSLPRRERRLVEAWAELHQAELLADWERLQTGRLPMPIEPLA